MLTIRLPSVIGMNIGETEKKEREKKNKGQLIVTAVATSITAVVTVTAVAIVKATAALVMASAKVVMVETTARETATKAAALVEIVIA